MPAAQWHPSYANGFARNAAEAANPGAWDGLVLNVHAPLGNTGDLIHDVSGHGKNGTNNGVTFMPGGVMGGAWDFNGSSDYTDLGSTILNPFTTYTIAAWVFATGWGESGFGRIYEEGTNGVDGISLFVRDTTDNVRLVHNRGAPAFYESTANSFTLNEWHHVVAVYNGTRGWIYVDGDDVTDDSTVNTPIVTVASANIGRRRSGNDRFFDGRISSVATYNRVFAPSEIRAHANDPHYIVRPKQLAVPSVGVAKPLVNSGLVNSPVIGSLVG